MAEMRDHDASADDKPNIQGVVDLGIAPTCLDALLKVVIDAVIAAQHQGRDKPQQLFRFARKRAIPITSAIETEEAIDAEMIDLEDALIHLHTS